jgi:hypothetical protein
VLILPVGPYADLLIRNKDFKELIENGFSHVGGKGGQTANIWVRNNVVGNFSSCYNTNSLTPRRKPNIGSDLQALDVWSAKRVDFFRVRGSKSEKMNLKLSRK